MKIRKILKIFSYFDQLGHIGQMNIEKSIIYVELELNGTNSNFLIDFKIYIYFLSLNSPLLDFDLFKSTRSTNCVHEGYWDSSRLFSPDWRKKLNFLPVARGRKSWETFTKQHTKTCSYITTCNYKTCNIIICNY